MCAPPLHAVAPAFRARRRKRLEARCGTRRCPRPAARLSPPPSLSAHRRDEDAGDGGHGRAAVHELGLLVPLERLRVLAEAERVEAVVARQPFEVRWWVCRQQMRVRAHAHARDGARQIDERFRQHLAPQNSNRHGDLRQWRAEAPRAGEILTLPSGARAPSSPAASSGARRRSPWPPRWSARPGLFVCGSVWRRGAL